MSSPLDPNSPDPNSPGDRRVPNPQQPPPRYSSSPDRDPGEPGLVDRRDAGVTGSHGRTASMASRHGVPGDHGYGPDRTVVVPAAGATGEPDRYDRDSVLAREREGFGGIKFGAAFFGWLAATGLAVIVIAILAGAGVAFGLTDQDAVSTAQSDEGTARTVGLVGGIVLLVVLLVAYFCGGYVAGRMARFNGAKQGLAVWLWAIITTLIMALIVWIAGDRYNILAQLNLPRIPIDEGTVTTAGLIAAAAALLAALVGAVLGGKAGTRWHRKIDRAGFAPPTD